MRPSIAPLLMVMPLVACAPPAPASGRIPPPSATIAAAAQSTSAAPAPRVTAGKPSAPLVVAIVVDQLAAWVAAERWPELPKDGGFARLRREGIWVKSATYLHAVTETAPGHAALFTGQVPSVSGIVGNTVWRTDLKKSASLLEDNKYLLVNGSGPVPKPNSTELKNGVSLDNLRVSTLADELLKVDPEAVVVAVSMKDRGALFAGGRSPTAAIFMDDDAGTWVTSRRKDDTAPLAPWVREVLAAPILTSNLDWNLQDRAFVVKHMGTVPDAESGETPDLCGKTDFPHGPSSCPKTTFATNVLAKHFKTTPMADALLAKLAATAVRKARKPDHTMLLSVSFSANDYIGHAYGPNSWEAWDALAQLDATLARLLNDLDAEVGPDGYAVVLSGDHGIVPFPEFPGGAEKAAWCEKGARNPYDKPCSKAHRLSIDAIKKAVDSDPDIKTALGWPIFAPKEVVVHAIESVLTLSPDAVKSAPPASERRSRLDAILRRKLMASKDTGVRGIADVVSIAEFHGECPPPPDDSLRALVCRATVAELGDYYVVPELGSFFGGGDVGVSHGSPYRYDRTVPLVVRYPQRAGEQEITDPCIFGSYYASLWAALTGKSTEGSYGGAISGVPGSAFGAPRAAPTGAMTIEAR